MFAWNNERDQLLRSSWAAGFSQAEICVQLGRECNKAHIQRRRKALGLPLRRPKGLRARKSDRVSYHYVPHETRLCLRPPVLPYQSTTARLMGDPPPGRTPWSGSIQEHA